MIMIFPKLVLFCAVFKKNKREREIFSFYEFRV